MRSTTMTVVSVLWILPLAVSGCDSAIDSLFGRTVPVNKNDSTEPSVRIMLADVYVRQPAAGDLYVESGRRYAQVEPFINVAVVGYDPEGVRFVELSDIVIEPFCGPALPENTEPSSVSGYRTVEPVTVPGERIEMPESSTTTTTRITLVKPLRIATGVGVVSSHCPADRPRLGNAIVRLTARAGNFGGLTKTTGTAVLSLRQISSSEGLAEGGVVGDPRSD